MLLLLPVPGLAQSAYGPDRAQPPAVLDLRVGAASPKGGLGDLAGDGVLVGVGGAYRLLPRVELRGELAVESFARGGQPGAVGHEEGPLVTLWHYLAGLQVELTDPVISKWEIALTAMGGGTYVDVRDGPAAIPDFTGHKPTVHLSGQVGYDLFTGVTLYTRAGGSGLLGNASDPPAYLGQEIVLTHAAGLRLRF